jgi:hypothetical protein
LYARPPLIDTSSFDAAVLAGYPQYSPLPVDLGPATIELRPAHNAIRVWSWGETESHLPAGARSAVLVDLVSAPDSVDALPSTGRRARDERPVRLQVGDVVVLEETADPATDGLGPADPSHRQAVRLTHVRRLVDELYDLPLVEVQWADEDALTFDLAVTSAGRFCCQADANVVLVEHGIPVQAALDPGQAVLGQAPLTFSTPFPDPAAVAAQQAHALRGLYADWREEV